MGSDERHTEGGRILVAATKRTYTGAFEAARALGRLFAPDDLKWEIELPLNARHVPLILHISCNAHMTLFIPYIGAKVLDKLGLDYVIMGGPESCCGSIHKNLGDGGREIHDYRPLAMYETKVEGGEVYVKIQVERAI